MKNLFFFIGTYALLFTTSTAPAQTHINTGFIENKGQIHDQYRQLNSDVKYLYCSPGFNVQLRSNGFSYDTYREVRGEATAAAPQKPGDKLKLQPPPPVRKYHRVDVELVGSNPDPEIIASGKSTVFMNYITEVETGKAISDIHDYEKVLYKNIYPLVDLEFHVNAKAGNGPKAEYDFIVHPGGDAGRIKLKYNGANAVGIEGAHLKIEVATGVFNEAIPHSYLRNSGEDISVKYIKAGINSFSFCVPQKHYTSDLIIDPAPALLWCTYYGGSAEDGASSIADAYLNGGIALDDTGNVYFTGFTFSSTSIATAGAYESSYSGTQEPFLAKFNPTGSTLLWGTYIDGGTCTVIAASPPTGTGVACDAAGNVYFVGITYTGQTVFIAKLSGAGAFDWSANCGGDGAFGWGGPGIAVDRSGNVYVTGSNGVAYGPCYFPWYTQGFIAKYNTSGAQQWLKEVGPLTTSPADVFTSGNSLALDDSGNIYVTGMTSSATGIATAGTYLQTYGAGFGDMGGSVYVAKFDSTGTQQWGTYYAGINSCCFGGVNNEGASIAVDNTGVYITGVTCQNTGVATSGAYKTSFAGSGGNNANIFVAKFSLAGGLDWGTYYGGAGSTGSNGSDAGMGIATDGKGNVYVTGATTSPAYIASYGSFETSLSGTSNAFLADFNSSNGTLTWGTYFHGTSGGATLGTGIVLDGKGKAFLVGETTDSTGFSTPGVWQPNYGGDQDVFVASFAVGSVPLNATVQIIQPACSGETNDTVTAIASGGTPPYKYLWSPGGQTTTTVTGLSAGTYTVKITDSTNTSVVDTIKIVQPSLVSVTTSPGVFICSSQSTTLTAYATGGTPGYTYHWSPANGLNNTVGSSVIAGPASTTTYSVTVTDANSCQSSPATVTVAVDSLPPPVITGNTAPCLNVPTTYTINHLGATLYQWQITGGWDISYGGGGDSITITWLAVPAVLKVDYLACGSVSDTTTLIINPVSTGTSSVTISANPSGSVCAGTPITFTANPSNGGMAPIYLWERNGNNAGADSTYSGVLNNNDSIVCIMTSSSGCTDKPVDTSNVIIVQVDSMVTAGAVTALQDAICDGDTGMLTVTGNTAPVQWQSSLTGNSFTNIKGADNENYSAVASENTYYRVYTVNGACSDTSSSFRLIINPLPSPFAFTNDSIICSSDSALIQTSKTYVSYLWNNSDTGSYTYADAAGGYWVTVTDTNGCSAVSNHVTIGVYPAPSVSITVDGDTLSSFGAIAYQWYLNGDSIPGATSSVYVAREPGEYSVQITDTNGCKTMSGAQQIVSTSVNELNAGNRLDIYPNPFNNAIHIDNNSRAASINSVEIYDVLGRIMLGWRGEGNHSMLDVEALPAAVYLIRVIMNTGQQYSQKIIKQ